MKPGSHSRGFGLACAAIVAILLAGCSSALSNVDAALVDATFTHLRLLDAHAAPRFSFAFSCGGRAAAESQLCSVPTNYFRAWAGERHIAIRELPDAAAPEAHAAPAAAERAPDDVDYRVVVRFAPVISIDYMAESDGLGGVRPPRAGYDADVYIYAATDGALVAHTDYHRQTDAALEADAVPDVRAGALSIVAALDAVYVAPVDEFAARARCGDRPGHSLQGCGERAEAAPRR